MPGIQRINIEQQMAAIGIETTPAKMHITLPRLMMKVHNEIPKMQIDSKTPTFKINRKKFNADMGIKSPSDLSKAYRDKGKQGALKGAGDAASKGNTLGDTRRKGNRVSQLARSRTLSAALKKKQTNIGLVPKNRPEVTWDPGYMKINWSRYNISIDWTGEYLPQVTIDPKHSIEVFLREKPYFRILVEEGEDPYAPGKHVDQTL